MKLTNRGREEVKSSQFVTVPMSTQQQQQPEQNRTKSPIVTGQSSSTPITLTEEQKRSEQEALEKDLTAERSLGQIFIKSWRMEVGRRNIFYVLPLFAIFTTFACLTHLKTTELATLARSVAELGFNFGLSILGFLLAGFTIFATLSRPELFVWMAKIRDDKTGLSTLKRNFFAILNVFIFYLLFVMGCLLIRLLAFSGGPLTLLLEALPKSNDSKMVMAKVGFVILGTGFWFVLTLLQSFVFNVYHFVMSGVRWDMMEEVEHEAEHDHH